MQPTTFRLDPFSLAQIGMATWLTELVVAQRFAEAMGMQGKLMLDGMDRLSALHSVSNTE
jgi:hypothetical protein